MKLSKISISLALAVCMAAPQIASADDAFEFHGYARWGTQYEQDGNTDVAATSQTGNAAGRLGNEGNGGELLFVKKFASENGSKWDVGYMVEDWGTLATKQFYAGATNIFAAQPNAYIWAGKVFHGRLQQGLSDYYITQNDGQGAGIKGLELGFADLEVGFVDGGSGHNYAFTSKLSGIQFSDDISMDIIANYGFTDDQVETDDDGDVVENVDAYQLVAQIKGWGQNFYYRHADNVENSLSWGREEGLSSDYFSVDGSYSLGEKTGVEYLAAFHDIDSADDAYDRITYNVILRPTHAWNDIHSTWIEAGYSVVDFDDDQQNNEAWKVTFSQNIAVGAVTWARPMLRFYVTVGEEKNAGETENPVIAGAMFEAWW